MLNTIQQKMEAEDTFLDIDPKKLTGDKLPEKIQKLFEENTAAFLKDVEEVKQVI